MMRVRPKSVTLAWAVSVGCLMGSTSSKLRLFRSRWQKGGLDVWRYAIPLAISSEILKRCFHDSWVLALCSRWNKLPPEHYSITRHIYSCCISSLSSFFSSYAPMNITKFWWARLVKASTSRFDVSKHLSFSSLIFFTATSVDRYEHFYTVADAPSPIWDISLISSGSIAHIFWQMLSK